MKGKEKPSKNEIFDYIKKRFDIEEDSEGNLKIETSDGKLTISNTPKPARVIPSSSDSYGSFDKIPDFEKKRKPLNSIGMDDIYPDLENRIKKDHKIQGMIPTPESLIKKQESSDENPLIKRDPIHPNSKWMGNFPDPDNDEFLP